MKSNKIDDFGDISPSYIPPSLTQKHAFHLLIKATQLPCCGTLFSLKSYSTPHTLLSPFQHSPMCTTAVTHMYGGRHTSYITATTRAYDGRQTVVRQPSHVRRSSSFSSSMSSNCFGVPAYLVVSIAKQASVNR